MPEMQGEFKGSAPYILSRIIVAGETVARPALLLDSGAVHVLVVIPSWQLSSSAAAHIKGWPLETLYGLGTMQAYRGSSVTLQLEDTNGTLISIPLDAIHFILYDDDDDQPRSFLPPSLLGFQHGAFGMSQLLIDNANQRVSLTYQEPFTPTRLE
ncbi:MAG: hypothetical protein NTZ05_12085 [Chloroflexi bacterium]|nr:hypothetical protein [Chloroflexota bacterium]